MEALAGFPQAVVLRNGIKVVVKPMEPADGPALLAFFQRLPEQDRMFLREDVTRPEVVDRFVKNLNYGTVLPLLAHHDGEIVGDATLHRTHHGWQRHVAQVRMVVAAPYQRLGLGTALARPLVKHAIAAGGVDKLVAEVVDGQVGAERMFEKLGFTKEAVLKRHVTDIFGRRVDLFIMTNDVSHVWEQMEALVSDFSPTRE